MPLRRRRVRAAVAAAVAAAVFTVVIVLRPGGTRVVAPLTGIVTLVLAAAVGVVWFRAGHWATGRARVALRLLGTAVIAWAVGGAVWIQHDLAHHIHGDVPPLANVGYAVTMIGAPTAVALLVSKRTPTMARTALDGLIIALSLLFISWATVLGPLVDARHGRASAGSVVYPLADILIASMVLILLRDARVRLRTSVEIAAVGMLVMMATDSYYAYLAVEGVFRTGNAADLGWFVAFAIIGVGAPHREELGGADVMADSQPSRVFLPYVPFALALGTGLVLLVVRHGRLDPLLYALTTALTALVLVRQLITLNDNRVLTRQLSAVVEDLRYRVHHDPLTRLANRAMFMDAVETALAPVASAPVAVLFVDLDGFKPVNDSHGHAAGDAVLVAVADRLSSAARAGDVVARVGGDEFALLLPGLRDERDAQAVAERVLAALDAPVAVGGEAVRVGASIGIAYGTPGRVGSGELLRNADIAMYSAKVGGRNRTVVFAPDLASGAAKPA